MRTLAACLVLCACGSSSPRSTGPSNAAGKQASDAPDDVSLDRDLQRMGTYLASSKEADLFTSSEIIGWTADGALVYRTALCDPDAFGGRGAYCTVDVCVTAKGAKDPTCDAPVDITVNDHEPFDVKASADAVRAAETAKKAVTRGRPDEPSSATVVPGKDVALTIPSWFGDAKWTIFAAAMDTEYNEQYGYTKPAITSMRVSDDGACLAVAGTALQQGRYESVTGYRRIGFAAQRCR